MSDESASTPRGDPSRVDEVPEAAGGTPAPGESPLAEAALRRSEARYRALAMASADVIYRMSPDWTELRQLEGRGFLSDTPEPSGVWVGRYIHPEDQARVTAAIQEAVRTRSTFELEHRVIRADGTLGWTHSRAVPLFDSQGEITEWVGAASDVTARRQAEEALRESEERYRTLFNAMDEAYAVVEVIPDGTGGWRDFRFLEVNPAFMEHTSMPYPVGKTATELLGTPNARWAETYGRVAETGEPVRFEETEFTLGRVFDLNVFPLGGPGSRRVAVLFTNVTMRKRTEAALRESEERFRHIVEGARDYAILTSDLEGRITSWSPGAEAVFGWTAEEAIGQDMAVTFTPEDRANGVPEQERATACEQGCAPDVRWHVRKDGSRVFIEGVARALDDPEDTARAILKIGQDVTERRKAEEALREVMAAVARANEELELRVEERTATLLVRTQELAAMNELREELLRRLVTAQEQERGRIARDLHDDTGQQVTGLLLGLGRLLKSPAAADPAVRETLEGLQALAGDVAQKSHQLAVMLRPIALDDLGLASALTQYAQEWSSWTELPVQVETVGLELRLPREIETTIYRVAQEALTNVLRHARDGGHAQATWVSILVQRRAGEVLTVIEDNGPGFDLDTTLNLPPGQRRLGIFGMQERARFAGGELTVESQPGAGTTVYLRLPMPTKDGSDG